MLIRMLKGKIHRARVTDTNLSYTGSITIDRAMMDAAGIVPNEVVLVANLTNGTRFETYVQAGEPGSGIIGILGAAARLADVGDRVIIMAFALVDEKEAAEHQPKVVLLDENNEIRSGSK
ncbi:MAG: aspartate 1-decarboxylase [Phycisphaerae bacterium]|nr:aspartate 1-decarboxylase [Phycisphaerae bacterium]